MKLFICMIYWTILLSFWCSSIVYSVTGPLIDYQSRVHPVIGRTGMVATQEALASRVGYDILKMGGNAVDAAVAVGFTLAVTLPRAGNLGGGGFMLVHIASENRVVALDYREKAPLVASPNMYLNGDGSVDTQRSKFHIWSTGVPGTVFGLVTAWEKYGSLPLQVIVDPAIRLAEEGIDVSYDLAVSLQRVKSRLSQESQSVFLKSDGTFYNVGDRLVQPDLAWSLKQIARDGKNSFYTGEIAEKIVEFMQKNGGLITTADLARYASVWRLPVTGNYHGDTIYAMPPPSSGGVHLIQMLNVLESFPLHNMGHNSAQYSYYLAETMKVAYADRSQYLGDPDFVTVPVAKLTSKAYGNQIAQTISKNLVRPSSQVLPGEHFHEDESFETTHYSIVDQWGNAVANTYTLNFSYGNGLMVPGTGILLNNEMDDFSVKPGTANAYGLLGGQNNSILPEKRMLSSMTPTFVFRNGALLLVTGTPGGSRIITLVLQQLLNCLTFDMNIADATVRPKLHHQWFPDQLFLEQGISQDTIDQLIQLGYQIKPSPAVGSLQSIMRKDGYMYGFSDLRKPGALTIGL